MRIVLTRSRFNGLEFLLLHKAELWREFMQAIEQLDADESDPARIGNELAGLIASDNRIALNVQPNGMTATSDALAKHYLQYALDEIDVGIEILLMKSYDSVLQSATWNGRGVPAVPLVMIGIAP